MKAATQYNGLVLLNGYLQRLYVFEKTKGLLNNGSFNVEKIDTITQQLKKVLDIAEVFNSKKSLDEPNKNNLLEIAEITEKLSEEYKNEMIKSKVFKEELAVTASAIYAEEHINNGIIQMGELFNPEVKDRFMQHILYYRNRVAVVNSVVQKETEGTEQLLEDTFQIKTWFIQTLQNAEYISKDFESIKEYLRSK
ncbi:hypothetical protein [uncultured Psychrobacillus sp.]|uniref:hypothetical protein n=1 Tax=uncultured Psychrobacillus sp. TaxID=1551585 RepID=UPI0026093E0A|nr:hypothetical protein [uncultured Psychrobacillus sp.]